LPPKENNKYQVLEMEALPNEAREKKARKIMKIYNWTRFILLVIFIILICIGLSKAS